MQVKIITEQGEISFHPQVSKIRNFLIVVVAAVAAYFIPFPAEAMEAVYGPDGAFSNVNRDAAHVMMSIFVLAAGLWVLEAVPPFATAILIIALEVYILGMPNGLLGLESRGLTSSWQIFINPLANPVIVLFFGGFVLAAAATKHGLDIRMARMFLRPFGTNPSFVLLGIILTTGVFSMFMSNTATTAMMIAIMTPVIHLFEQRDQFRKALVLAVPFAANIGGIGTIIGTPPNAVAASLLSAAGPDYTITFLKWMLFGVPLAVGMMFVLWGLLLALFKPKHEKLEALFPEPEPITLDVIIVAGVFALTIGMWITSPWHKIPSAVVAMVPITVFTLLSVLDAKDLNTRIEWNVLILVCGGLILGVGMQTTGLASLLVETIPFNMMWLPLLIGSVMIVTTLMSNFMSNTSASNLLIPIILSIAVSMPTLSHKMGAVAVALAASLAMSLPISTPPNAIAFATKEIDTKTMAKVGTIVSVIGLLLAFAMLFLFNRIGVL